MTLPSVATAPLPWADGATSIRRHGVTLSNCDAEPVQTPGCIQAHGALRVVRPYDFVILPASENSADLPDLPDLPGLAPGQLLGQPIAVADRLAADYPAAAACSDPSSGLLALPLSASQRTLLWRFRAQTMQTVAGLLRWVTRHWERVLLLLRVRWRVREIFVNLLSNALQHNDKPVCSIAIGGVRADKSSAGSARTAATMFTPLLTTPLDHCPLTTPS